MMKIERTQEEIAGRIRDITEHGNGRDLHGAERSRLLEALEFETAKEFLRPGHPHDEKSWNARRYDNAEKIKAEIQEYLPFAWSKANGKRINSSLRSLCHFVGMIWLLGYEYDDLVEEIEELFSDDENLIPYYGKTALVSISERFGFEWKADNGDNGEWHRSSTSPVELAHNVLGR